MSHKLKSGDGIHLKYENHLSFVSYGLNVPDREYPVKENEEASQ